jgi:hypothetical protein
MKKLTDAQRSKSAKATQPVSTKIPENAGPESTEGQLVRVHDLTGVVAVFAIPGELRQILNEEEYARCLASIDAIEVTLIVREKNDVIYVRMSSMALEPTLASDRTKELWKIPLGKTAAKKPTSGKPSAKSGRQERDHD